MPVTAEELSSSEEGEFTYLISISTFCYDFGDVFEMMHKSVITAWNFFFSRLFPRLDPDYSIT